MALVLSSVATLACANAKGASRDGSLIARGVFLDITNEEPVDRVIYVLRDGTSIRVRTVPALGRGTLLLTSALLGDGVEIRLGAAERGRPIERLSMPLVPAPGRIASWIVRQGRVPSMVIVR